MMNDNIDIIDIDDEIEFVPQNKQITVKLERKKDVTTSLKELGDFIEKEKFIRDDLISETSKKLNENNKFINSYNQLVEENKKIKSVYKELYIKYKKDNEKYKELEKDYENLNKEIVDIKKENTTTSRKLTSIQSLLQLLINEYSIYEICEITRLTEEKIKDFLN